MASVNEGFGFGLPKACSYSIIYVVFLLLSWTIKVRHAAAIFIALNIPALENERQGQVENALAKDNIY